MSNQFIYDIKKSRLYSADGRFLKKVFCPKSKHWNQLLADDPHERSRGCQDCGERVINLEEIDPFMPLIDRTDCVYIPAQSKRVIFLNAEYSIPSVAQTKKNKRGIPIILTVRTVNDINRAANMGYWPDVRLIDYKDSESQELFEIGRNFEGDIDGPIRSKVSVGQHTETGRIRLSGDFRATFASEKSEPNEIPSFLRANGKSSVQNQSAGYFKEVIPFTYYYPHYQKVPIAAYLIPPGLENGSEVLVEDPIEDYVGSTWNQGDTGRATKIKGYVRDLKVFLAPETVERNDYIG